MISSLIAPALRAAGTPLVVLEFTRQAFGEPDLHMHEAHTLAPGAGAEAILRQLWRGDPVDARAVIVAAHPDDETVGMGARLANFRGAALIIHLTDGSPDDLRDARNAG